MKRPRMTDEEAKGLLLMATAFVAALAACICLFAFAAGDFRN